MQEIKDDILERTYHMKSSCLAMETTGIQTIMSLANQGDQLKDLDIRLKSIDTGLTETKQDINRLKGVTQRVMDSFRTKIHRKIFSKIMLHSTGKQKSLSSPISTPPRRKSSISSTSKIIQNRIPSTKSFTDEQIDETLDDIEEVIHRLKSIAQNINDELVGQTDTIHHIQEHMQDSTIRIQRQNTELIKLIH